MKRLETLPGFNYKPFTKEDLVKLGQELRESGKCSVQNPDFYKPWNMVEVNSEEYENRTKLPRETVVDRRERRMKLMGRK